MRRSLGTLSAAARFTLAIAVTFGWSVDAFAHHSTAYFSKNLKDVVKIEGRVVPQAARVVDEQLALAQPECDQACGVEGMGALARVLQDQHRDAIVDRRNDVAQARPERAEAAVAGIAPVGDCHGGFIVQVAPPRAAKYLAVGRPLPLFLGPCSVPSRSRAVPAADLRHSCWGCSR